MFVQQSVARRTLLTPKSLQAAVEANRKFTYIPLAYVLLRVWGSVRYIIEVAGVSKLVYTDRNWLYYTLLYLHVSYSVASVERLFSNE